MTAPPTSLRIPPVSSPALHTASLAPSHPLAGARACPRWLVARAALAALHGLWVALAIPATLPFAGALLLLATAALVHDRDRPAPRLLAWFASLHLTLAALQLSAGTAPLVIGLGAAVAAHTASTLFLAHRPRLALALTPFIALLAGALSVFTRGPLMGGLESALAFAALLGLFATLRPLAALARVLAALDLHRGPADPLLLWAPLRPPHPASSEASR